MKVTSEQLPAEVHVYKGTNTDLEKVLCSGHFLLIFVRSGIFRGLIDGEKVFCTSGELLLAVSREYYQVLKCSKKVIFYFVKVQRQFMLDTKMFYHFIAAFITKNPVKLIPDEFDRRILIRVIKLLYYYYQTRTNSLRFSVQSYAAAVSLLVFQAGWHYGQSANSNGITYNRKEVLTMGFLKLLLKNFRQQHSVRFYSDILCVTDGYLNKAVRQVTGKTVGVCIAEIILSEAKYLLVHYDYKIEFISEQLNFTSAGSFSRFFKKYTLLTPTAYRKDFQ